MVVVWWCAHWHFGSFMYSVLYGVRTVRSTEATFTDWTVVSAAGPGLPGHLGPNSTQVAGVRRYIRPDYGQMYPSVERYFRLSKIDLA